MLSARRIYTRPEDRGTRDCPSLVAQGRLGKTARAAYLAKGQRNLSGIFRGAASTSNRHATSKSAPEAIRASAMRASSPVPPRPARYPAQDKNSFLYERCGNVIEKKGGRAGFRIQDSGFRTDKTKVHMLTARQGKMGEFVGMLEQMDSFLQERCGNVVEKKGG